MSPFKDIFWFIGLFMIIAGLFNILGRNFLWKFEQFRQALWGKRVERASLWDFWKVLGGLVMLVIGAGFLLQ